MSVENTALIAVLAGTAGVGPGVVVVGTVIVTLGRVALLARPVVNCQLYGAVITRPLALLDAAVTVAVYTVLGASDADEASAKVAMVLAEFSVTVPTGLTQGAAQATMKLAAPVMGATGTLKAAVMMVLLIGTPVALLTGATAVTVGAMFAGKITGVPAPLPAPLPIPRTGAWPPPQAAIKAVASTTSNVAPQGSALEIFL
jgi:hypothetical protein